MKRLKIMMIMGFCGAFLLMLVGCQQQGQQELKKAEDAIVMDVSDKQKDIENSFYVLIVGNDSRLGTVSIKSEYYADGLGRSDTMMLARVDPEEYQITLITIPRDTAAPIDGGTYKINEAYRIGGIEAAIDQVESLTGVTIRYYLDTGFVGFEEMVNGWGGVTANVPFAFSLTDGITGKNVELSEGEQLLDGPGALALARMRQEYSDYQDACRQMQDRQLVERAIQQTADDPARVAGDVAVLLASVDTNWPADEFLATASDFVENSDKLRIYSGSGPYDGGIDESAGGQWLATRDEATWRKIIEVVDAGGDPTTVLPLPTLE